MKKRYSLPFLQRACFLLLSLLLQNCGTPHDLLVEVEPLTTTTKQEEGQDQGRRKRARIEIGEEQEPNLIEQGQEISSFDIFPLEIWQEIFSHLDFEGILVAKAVNRDWNELITGFRQTGIIGVENRAFFIIDRGGWTLKKEIDFRDNKLKTLTPATIPSFAFYHLMGHVNSLSQSFWPYLQGTRVHTVNLTANGIGVRAAEAFARALKGTQVHTVNLTANGIGVRAAEAFARALEETRVHTVNLSNNQIGSQGAEAFARALKGTQVHTVNLSYNRIGVVPRAEQFAKHLEGTQVHTIDLSQNYIGDQGAIALAKYLQGTNIHTVDLSENYIGPDVQSLLLEQYPHINWMF